MKRIGWVVIATLIAAAPQAFSAGKHSHDPKHGGVVVEAKDVDYELVAQPELIRLYVRDHGKAVDLTGASAKLTLLIGNDTSEVTLAPAGDKLEAKGAFKVGAGTKVVAMVTLAGKKPVPVRFVLK